MFHSHTGPYFMLAMHIFMLAMHIFMRQWVDVSQPHWSILHASYAYIHEAVGRCFTATLVHTSC